jgi:hypothetical protein
VEARTILALCDRFHKLPEEILAADTSLLRLIHIEALGKREEENPDG